jgi:hypothetical protein
MALAKSDLQEVEEVAPEQVATQTCTNLRGRWYVWYESPAKRTIRTIVPGFPSALEARME